MFCQKKVVVANTVPHVDVLKEEDFWQWFRQTVQKGELVDRENESSACFVIRPGSQAIWERIQAFLDNRLRCIGVGNCSFPVFVLKGVTDTNVQQVEGHAERLFTDQVTTSSIIYSHYARWIQSHRDLPLRLNQWKPLLCYVSNPQPFLRSPELQVQEAHTAHLTQKDAYEEVEQALELYADLHERHLAVPVVKGQKSSLTKRKASRALDGAHVNESVILSYVPVLDQCIESATCHGLGQSFSKLHGITVLDPSIGSSESPPLVHVWQNSWHFSSRAIGIMIATHGDNEGLVLPPNVAEYQVVIIPHSSSTREQEYQIVLNECALFQSKLTALDVRTKVDQRDGCSAGWKLHEWIIRGAPLCIILGLKALSGQYATIYRRDLPKESRKIDVPCDDIPAIVPKILEDLQQRLFQKARSAFSSRQRQVTDWNEFICHLCNRKGTSICLAPHCLTGECEQQIEGFIVGSDHDEHVEEKRVKCLCIPSSQPETTQTDVLRCINPHCVLEAKSWAMFGPKFE